MALPLFLHQSISVFNTGGTPNLVYLVTHKEETHWTELLDRVKQVLIKRVDEQTIVFSVKFQAASN